MHIDIPGLFLNDILLPVRVAGTILNICFTCTQYCVVNTFFKTMNTTNHTIPEFKYVIVINTLAVRRLNT